MALTHCNWTGGLLPVNALSYILGASIQPLAWLCVGCSGLVRVYQACAVFLMQVVSIEVVLVEFTDVADRVFLVLSPWQGRA